MIGQDKPLSLINDLQRELSNFFPSSAIANFDSEEWSPAVDITDEEDKFVIKADLPGVKSEDIKVTVENDVLTIKGERESEKREQSNNYKRIERFSGSFMRRFTLPEAANLEKIKAKTTDGVLELTVPKKAKAQAKPLEIKVEK